MAIRKILKYGDPLLRQKSKEVSKISKKIQTLAEDMLDTMYANNGVGLAAPQVGELLRMFVIDVSTPKEKYNPIVLINPKIIKKSGAVACNEGCLSFPEVYTDVRRYKNVTVKALDIKGKPFIIEGKDGELLARALQHEFDHLDGILFIDHVRNRFEADKKLEEKGLPPVQADKLIDETELENIIAETNSVIIDKVEEDD
ncbi:peptide deformylase [bacterium]|nr:peptide deformylase [bacterium]